MVKSMTGYGRFEGQQGARKLIVELKSVNHKSFECSCRVPRVMMFLEEPLKAYVQSRVSRGKIDIFLTVEGESDAPATVVVNHSLAAGYLAAYQEIAQTYGISCNVTAESLARVPDLLTVHKPAEDEEVLWQAVKTVAAGAVDAFIAMREQEGKRLKEDVENRLVTIEQAVEKIEAENPKTVAAYRARLEEKMKELLGSATVDEQRLLTETAIFADRVAVDEETVRLRSHCEQIRCFLQTDQPVGRRLDFLMQEANREINTVGSKSQNLEIANIVVTVKAELEKIREQIQNLE